MKKILEEKKRCPECGGRIVYDPEKGEYFCQECGLIIKEEEFQRLPEWRAFTPEQKEKRPRTGPPLKPGESVPATEIKGTKDAYGRSLNTKEREIIYRIRKWQKRIERTSLSYEEKIPYREIRKFAILLNLPKRVEDLTIQIYRKVLERKLVKGRDKKTVSLATIYTATRILKVPITLTDFSKISGIPKKNIARMYKKILNQLKLGVLTLEASDYISIFCEKLKLSEEVKERSLEIAEGIKANIEISEKSPPGIAAAIIYIASALLNERKTQKEIAKIAGVTEVTIRNIYREIIKELDIRPEQIY